jgi:hypothetical protein
MLPSPDREMPCGEVLVWAWFTVAVNPRIAAVKAIGKNLERIGVLEIIDD